ncbi:MAG: hypothetical protein Q8M94_22175 [Ignavibacteria bacterium]|nr:hypothetical protein [Ignavibacteria bacterium]
MNLQLGNYVVVDKLTTKMIEGSYENVFRATMTILQDQGYVIKNTDMNSGLIVANIDRESSGGSQFAQALLFGKITDKNTVIEVSATINKLNEQNQELRLNIQETNYSGSGAKQNIKQIYNEQVYQKIFNEITLEVKRREAMNK